MNMQGNNFKIYYNGKFNSNDPKDRIYLDGTANVGFSFPTAIGFARGMLTNMYSGYCSIECEENNPDTFYCVDCGENKVDTEGNTCEDCESDSELYKKGDIVDESDYYDAENCWIAPNGNLHYVPYCNHDLTAHKLGFSGVTACERAGYIHVSVYWSRIDRFHYVPKNPTHAQIDTTRIYCDANSLDYPDFAEIKKIETAEAYTIQPVQNLSPAWLKMTRVERDRFYPLSGD